MKALLLKDLAKTKEYTIKVASAMPDEKFNFKPVEEVMNFGEQVHHMAYSLLWMDKNCLQKIEQAWAAPAIPVSKKLILEYLGNSFDIVMENINKTKTQDENYVAAFYFMLEHNAHHRGQAVTYLRGCGVVPPEFPF